MPTVDAGALHTQNRQPSTGWQIDTPAGAARLLRWFLVAHLLFWTVIPSLVKWNPSLDMVEQIFWGHEWQLGYTKHPPLTSWCCEAMAVATGRALSAQHLLRNLRWL